MAIPKSSATGGTDHFLGTFVSLVALQTAHPTATLGDYAIVEALPSEDAIVYFWDGVNWDEGIDPAQFLQSGLNLSDLGNKKVARVNLGVEGRTSRGDADYTIVSTDKYIAITAALTTIRTFTLPAAVNVNAGYEITIQDEVGAITGGKYILIVRASSDTINGNTSAAYLLQKRGRIRLTSNGVDGWFFDNRETRSVIKLAADVSNVATDTLADITELQFPVFNGRRVRGSLFAIYDSSSTAVGSRWSINSAATGTPRYESNNPLSTTTQTIIRGVSTFDQPAAANGSTAATAANIARLPFEFLPTSDGTIVARFAREGAAGSITAKAGSWIEFEELP
jgi:hypothetical protein